ncbi:hypothetical protein ACFVAQ_39855 [Streptomyces sp. NPDC057651]|uniref:hypothetical protein n=1 Tax=Streptomyces sp. NPDC057651 TaxID=3346194 RepID=UPI0036A1B000
MGGLLIDAWIPNPVIDLSLDLSLDLNLDLYLDWLRQSWQAPSGGRFNLGSWCGTCAACAATAVPLERLDWSSSV